MRLQNVSLTRWKTQRRIKEQGLLRMEKIKTNIKWRSVKPWAKLIKVHITQCSSFRRLRMTKREKKYQSIDFWSSKSFSFRFQIVVVWNNVKKAPPSGELSNIPPLPFGSVQGIRDSALASAFASRGCSSCSGRQRGY